MARFSAIRMWLFNVLNTRPAEPDVTDRSALVRAAMLADTISQRDSEGLSTTLRQLHTIAPLAQSEALKAVSELENRGLVTVEQNLHDTLDSQVIPTDKMRRTFARGFRCDAA